MVGDGIDSRDGVGGTSWIGDKWCGSASGYRCGEGLARGSSRPDHVEVPELGVSIVGFDYDLRDGKRGSAAVVAELPDRKERTGGKIGEDGGCARFGRKGG